jgi:hypothetical protein
MTEDRNGRSGAVFGLEITIQATLRKARSVIRLGA